MLSLPAYLIGHFPGNSTQGYLPGGSGHYQLTSWPASNATLWPPPTAVSPASDITLLTHGLSGPTASLSAYGTSSPTAPAHAASPPTLTTPGAAAACATRIACHSCSKTIARHGDMLRHAAKHDSDVRCYECWAPSYKYNGAYGFYRKDKLVRIKGMAWYALRDAREME